MSEKKVGYNSLPRIGIDLMGSDTPPKELLQAIPHVIEETEDRVSLSVFATEEVCALAPPNISCYPAKETISMDDDPISSVRYKKETSIAIGMQMLKEGKIDAFISAGNTGALLTSAKLSLSMLPGIDRPALLTLLPTEKQAIAVLDVGANITSKSNHLVQFAMMGIAYQKTRGIKNPRVGLLNIGSEAKKGTPAHKEAYQKLRTLGDSFLGNIEGKQAFQGNLDVLVTDGFTGNVFLKTAEGISAFILDQLQELITEECSDYMREVLATLRHRLHYAEYPGAILCGINKLVIKCHGDADQQSLISTIKGAGRLVEHQFLDSIHKQLIGIR